MPKAKPPPNRKPRPPAGGGPTALARTLQDAAAAYRQGNWAEAERLCRRVVRKRPGQFDALNLLGAIAAQTGRAEDAARLLRRAVAANPNDSQVHHNLGVVLAGLGRLGEALDAYDRALALAPDDVAALSNRGLALAGLGRPDEALASFDRALALSPGDAELYGNRGNALRALGRPADALDAFDRAIALSPGDAVAHSNRGVALRDLKRPADALAAFDRALALRPDHAAFHNNRGNVLLDLKRGEAALAAFDRALALRPDNAETHSNRGVALRCLGRLDDARAAFARALEIRPDHVDADWNLTVMELSTGDFERGWAGYLRRAGAAGLPPSVSREKLRAPVAGRRVFVLGEQGLGDEIFFLRFVERLKELGAGIAYRCDPRLAAMLGRLPFIDRIVGPEETPEAADLCFTSGDLPFILGMRSAADAPPPIALTPGAEDRDEIDRRLRALGPPPYIGVTWRAGPGVRGTLSKSAPLERLGAALRPVPATVVVVQRHPEDGETARLDEALGRAAHDFSALNEDLDAMLALMAALDDYICVSNTNLHLRTACGRACRVLVPYPPEFRWMLEPPESPWFPGSPLYRESPAGGWDDAFDRLAADLAASAGAGGALG